MCDAVAPVAVAPSPKLQLIVYGIVPLVVTAVKATGVFALGLVGRNVKSVDRGGVDATGTVWLLVTVFEGEDESVADSVTVNDWAVEYV